MLRTQWGIPKDPKPPPKVQEPPARPVCELRGGCRSRPCNGQRNGHVGKSEGSRPSVQFQRVEMTEESPPSLKGIQPARERPRRVRSSAPQARNIGADVPAHRRFLDLGGGSGGDELTTCERQGGRGTPHRRFCRDVRAVLRLPGTRGGGAST